MPRSGWIRARPPRRRVRHLPPCLIAVTSRPACFLPRGRVADRRVRPGDDALGSPTSCPCLVRPARARGRRTLTCPALLVPVQWLQGRPWRHRSRPHHAQGDLWDPIHRPVPRRHRPISTRLLIVAGVVVPATIANRSSTSPSPPVALNAFQTEFNTDAAVLRAWTMTGYTLSLGRGHSCCPRGPWAASAPATSFSLVGAVHARLRAVCPGPGSIGMLVAFR